MISRNSEGGFFAAHWDWLVAAAGVVALVAGVALFVMTGGGLLLFFPCDKLGEFFLYLKTPRVIFSPAIVSKNRLPGEKTLVAEVGRKFF